jgi:hypothetical protein
VKEWNRATDFNSLPEKKPMAGGWMTDEAEREKHAGTRGVFSAAAAKAGKSTKEYAREHQHDSGPKGSPAFKRGTRARMAMRYMSAQKG